MKINYVCSLGLNCHSSQILKINNLKLCSYPFDWVFSNYNIIIDCIETDFKFFIDKSYYYNISHKRCGHNYYKELLWWHHNPLRNSDDYEYYLRCIDRFQKLLNFDENKLFLMFFKNMNLIEDNLIKDLIEFNDKFSKYTKNYVLLIIFHIPNKDINNHFFTYNKNIHFLELHTLSESNGLTFNNKRDNNYLNKILNDTYSFEIIDNTNN